MVGGASLACSTYQVGAIVAITFILLGDVAAVGRALPTDASNVDVRVVAAACTIDKVPILALVFVGRTQFMHSIVNKANSTAAAGGC